MIKATEFWNCLCSEYDYRCFAGVPCIGLKPLYDKLNSEILFYCPTVKENIAIGLVSGTVLSGVRGGILIHMDRLYNILDWLISFNLEYKVPLLIIAYSEGNDNKLKKILSLYKIPYKNFNGDLKNLESIIKKTEELSIPGVCFIGKGEVDK